MVKVSLCVNDKVVNKASDNAAFNKITFQSYNKSLSVDELAKHIQLGHPFIVCRLKEEGGKCRRSSANFESSEIIGVDVDNDGEEILTYEDCHKLPLVSKYAMLTYHTASSKPEHHKFRILFRLSEPILDPKEYSKTVLAILDLFGASSDPSCKDVARMFFGSKGCKLDIINEVLPKDFIKAAIEKYDKKYEAEIAKMEPSAPIYEVATPRQNDNDSPQDEYNLRDDALHLLLQNGWLYVYERDILGGVVYLRRPGKTENLISAVWSQTNKRLLVWSSSTIFQPNKSYTPAAIYSLLKFGKLDADSLKQTTKELSKQGYGKKNKTKIITLDPPEEPSGNCQENPEMIPYFWDVIDDDSEEGPPQKIVVNAFKTIRFLEHFGFRLFLKPGAVTYDYIKISNNIVDEFSLEMVTVWITQYVMSLPDILPESYGMPNGRDSLLAVMIKGGHIFFGKCRLLYLETISPKWHRDNSSTCFIYYQNGFLEVTKTSYRLLSYDNLDGLIWRKNLLPRDFVDGEPPFGEFSTFAANISGNNEKRLVELQSAIGYLCHRYYNAAVTRAVIFLDANKPEYSDSEGGTGKSVFAKCLKYIRNLEVIDGKNFDFENRFSFEPVGLDTDVILFDDVRQKFQFELLFHVITDGLSIEGKNKKKLKLPAEVSPKICITTNYTITNSGSSSQRRKAEYELAPHYTPNHSPRDEFGHLLFVDWPINEWGSFDAWIVQCIQIYLNKSILIPTELASEERRLTEQTNSDFVDWANDFFFINLPYYDEKGVEIDNNVVNLSIMNKPYATQTLYKEFIEENESFSKLQKSTFSKWVMLFCLKNNISCAIKPLRLANNTNRIAKYFIFSR